jgi:hypothetical protein
MSIVVRCRCDQQSKAPDNAVGKRARCPRCGESLEIDGGFVDGIPDSIIARPQLNSVSSIGRSPTGKRQSKLILRLVAAGCFLVLFSIAERLVMQDKTIENQVAADAVRQYEIAKRNGNAMDAYTAAGMAVAAFLQANDEPNYQKWKKIEEVEERRVFDGQTFEEQSKELRSQLQKAAHQIRDN